MELVIFALFLRITIILIQNANKIVLDLQRRNTFIDQENRFRPK